LPGVVASTCVFPISVVIVALLVLAGLSYRQTISAYPGADGSFTVAKDNLGVGPGFVAAAALLTDYVLAVSVSSSSGVAAVPLHPGNAVRLRDRFDYDEQLDESLDEDMRLTREMMLMEPESVVSAEKSNSV
jgi:amino acid transporter